MAILLLTPEEGAQRAPIRLRRSSWRSILGVIAVVVAGGIALHAVSHEALGDAWGFGVGLGSIALAGVVATLVWLRLRGRGRERGRSSADRRLLRCLAFVTAVTAAVNRPSPPPQTPRLVLNADIGLGALFVADRPFDHAWNGGWGFNGGSGFQPAVYGTNEPCYRTTGAGR